MPSLASLWRSLRPRTFRHTLSLIFATVAFLILSASLYAYLTRKPITYPTNPGSRYPAGLSAYFITSTGQIGILHHADIPTTFGGPPVGPAAIARSLLPDEPNNNDRPIPQIVADYTGLGVPIWLPVFLLAAAAFTLRNTRPFLHALRTLIFTFTWAVLLSLTLARVLSRNTSMIDANFDLYPDKLSMHSESYQVFFWLDRRAPGNKGKTKAHTYSIGPYEINMGFDGFCTCSSPPPPSPF